MWATGPSFYSPNIWMKEIPDLEPAFKELGQLIVHVGTMLMKCVVCYCVVVVVCCHCDGDVVLARSVVQALRRIGEA